MQEEVQTRCIATWTTVILTRIWKYQTISWWSWMLQETSFPPFWLLPFGPEQRQHGTALDYARRQRVQLWSWPSQCLFLCKLLLPLLLSETPELQAQIGKVYSQTWRSKPASFAIACFLFSCKIVFIQHPQHVSNLWLRRDEEYDVSSSNFFINSCVLLSSWKKNGSFSGSFNHNLCKDARVETTPAVEVASCFCASSCFLFSCQIQSFH